MQRHDWSYQRPLESMRRLPRRRRDWSERPNPHSARTWGRLGGDPRLDDVERTLRREKAATRQRAGVHRYVCGAVLADARVAACAKGLCAQMPTSRGYENTLPWRGASAQRPGLAASESIRRDAPAATMCAGSGRRIQDANSPCALRPSTPISGLGDQRGSNYTQGCGTHYGV